MKKVLCCLLIMMLLFASAMAEYDLSSLSDEELFDLAYLVLDEIKLRAGEAAAVAEAVEISVPSETSQETVNAAEANIQTVKVKNYVGMRLSSCGYTSMGGDLRDYYGDTNLLLAVQSQDGTFIDPEDKAQLQKYTVVAQAPTANTSFEITTDDEDDVINRGYEEIVLVVTDGEPTDLPTLTDISASLNKETQYVRDYVGRNLQTVGYTAMNGNRYDKYGLDGRIKIEIFDEAGNMIDPEDYSEFKYYIVVGQNIDPNTEIQFTYEAKDDEEDVVDQSISVIEITVRMTENGRATLDALIAQEAALRESGALIDLFKGQYEIGKDLPAGNYTFSPLDITEGSHLYIYQDHDALLASDGEWEYVYGADDKCYYALKEGMYINVGSGSIKALRSSKDMGDDNLELFSGVYYVGEDIDAGNYEMRQISSSCNVYLYQNETAYSDDDCDWDFLYGAGDVGRYTLKDGMIIKIAGGAVNVTKR